MDGRWSGRDKLSLKNSTNLYCYVLNNTFRNDYIGLADVLYFRKRVGIKSTRYNQTISASEIEKFIKELLEESDKTKNIPALIDLAVDLAYPSLKIEGVQYFAIVVYTCKCDKKCLFGLFINKEIELPSWQMTIKPSHYYNDSTSIGGFGAMHTPPTNEELFNFVIKRSEYTTKQNEIKCIKGCKDA